MKSIYLLLFIYGFSSSIFGQCRNCTNLQEAFVEPTRVVELNLKNQLQLKIDTNFSVFSQLEKLNLSHSLIQKLEINNPMPTVLEVNLSHSYFNPWNLESLGINFPNLSILDLSHSSLGYLPDGLIKFAKLTELNLSTNKLISIPDEIQYLQQLKSLDLSNNSIQIETAILGYLWKLERLDIQSNPKLNLSALFISLSSNRSLQHLSFDATNLNSSNTAEMKNLPIKSAAINLLDEKSVKFLTNIPALTTLQLTNANNLELAKIAITFKSLSTLKLDPCNLTDKTFQNLTIDTLVLTDFSGIQPDFFKNTRRIAVLDLSSSSISAEDVDKLRSILPKTEIITRKQELIDSEVSFSRITVGNEKIPFVEKRIQSNEETVIHEKNAQISIPKSAFLTQSGEIYNGEVKIDLKVYSDAVELALDNAPMLYKTEGNTELFGSNAMLYFNATTETGEQLSPNPGAEINVRMKNNIPNTLGAMYEFDTLQNNWVQQPEQASVVNVTNNLARFIDSINQLNLFDLVETVCNDRRYALKVKTSKYDQTVLDFNSTFQKKNNTSRCIYYNRNFHLGKEICDQTWVIDTIVSPEMKENLLRIKKETKQKKISWQTSSFIPKLIWKISLDEQYEKDHYRITFNFKDSIVSLPIALKGENNQQIQRKHARFTKSLQKAKKLDAKNKKKAEDYRERNKEKLVIQVRNELINRFIADSIRLATPPLVLKYGELAEFGLPRFGLINIDIISKIEPIDFIALDKSFRDQNDVEFKTTSDLKIILIDNNTYFSAPINNVPFYSNSYGISVLNKSTIGVYKFNSINQFKSDVQLITIKINDLSPEEIALEIRKAYESN